MIPRTQTSRILGVALAGVALIALGAASMYLYLGNRPAAAAPAQQSAVAPATAPGEVVIALTPDAVSRSGIRTARPAPGRMDAMMVVPGVVEPNTYNQVVVRSVAAGQVRSVGVELGSAVSRGDLLATIHSPELAETIREYLSMQSEFDAAHQRQLRLESLVKIGAASQQELEIARAEHTRHSTDVESARATLTLLGLTPGQIGALNETARMDSTVRIVSPTGGVITARSINTGFNIDGSTDLFTIADLSTVWVVANVYERDLGRVNMGSTATVTASVVPGRRWSGRVAYIDPQLAPETRTAKVRVEVPNADRTLRFGMYADVALPPAAVREALLVPRSAIQVIGAQSVVYIADQRRPGTFLERPVAIGPASGDKAEVLAGLTEGDDVVVEGSFTLRAERERLGLPPPVNVSAPSAVPGGSAVQRISIDITKDGFAPASVEARAGAPIELSFTRRTDETCATEVEVPSIRVRKALPLNQAVSIPLPAGPARTLAFACGMNMLRGTLVVR